MSNSTISDQIRTVVINREKDTERRATMSKRLTEIGLAHEFFQAVDGHTFDTLKVPEYDGARRRRFFGRDLTPGEIGCLLSHRGVCQKMLTEGIPLMLVLEDDALLASDLPDVLQGILDGDRDWDMVRFLTWEKIFQGPHRIISQITPNHELTRVQATPGGAQGYLLTKHAAEVILEHTKRSWLPIDALYGRCWDTGLDIFFTKPSPVAEDRALTSTIGDTRFDKSFTASPLTKFKYKFFRLWYKLTSGLSKRSYFARTKSRDIQKGAKAKLEN
ncbi:MAG: glycosyltransferase family 25 protein [Parvibaculaceae bacterium]|nr:glycosyltransferase family 25 protein [Parvibaculaceae bacterium]